MATAFLGVIVVIGAPSVVENWSYLPFGGIISGWLANLMSVVLLRRFDLHSIFLGTEL